MAVVWIEVSTAVEVPDDTNLSLLAMTLQDSPTLLDEHLKQNGYEVIVFSKPDRVTPASADLAKGVTEDRQP